jgi:hypothetical protein
MWWIVGECFYWNFGIWKSFSWSFFAYLELFFNELIAQIGRIVGCLELAPIGYHFTMQKSLNERDLIFFAFREIFGLESFFLRAGTREVRAIFSSSTSPQSPPKNPLQNYTERIKAVME